METLPLLFLLIALGAFMFFASRRQKKAMQATINLHESLREGDRIHTTSGLQATIVGITDDSVDLEIAPGVVTRWMKLAVRDRIDPDDDDDTTEFDGTDSTSHRSHRDHGEHGNVRHHRERRGRHLAQPRPAVTEQLTFRTGTYPFRVRGERSQSRP